MIQLEQGFSNNGNSPAFDPPVFEPNGLQTMRDCFKKPWVVVSDDGD